MDVEFDRFAVFPPNDFRSRIECPLSSSSRLRSFKENFFTRLNWWSLLWQQHEKWSSTSQTLSPQRKILFQLRRERRMSVTPPEAPPYPSTPEEDQRTVETSTSAYAEILVRASFFRWENKRRNLLFQTFQWSFGFNKDLPVLNVSVNNTKKIFFAAAQIGVIHDFASNRQQLLIGHVKHARRSYLVSPTEFFREITSPRVVSATTNVGCVRQTLDEIVRLSFGTRSPGSSTSSSSSISTFVSINSFSVPTQTYFDVMNGTGTVAFSADAKYLASLSDQTPQVRSRKRRFARSSSSSLRWRSFRFGTGQRKAIDRYVH